MTTEPVDLTACRWPDLPAPYATALREAVRFILGRYPDVLGIIASGTIVRGTPSPTSDLDIYVLRRRMRRQRVQRFFNGVPAEIFVNPPAQVEVYFERELTDARMITAHMLATGFVVLSRDPVVDELREHAARLLASSPNLNAQRLTSARYMAALRYEDAMDIVDTRPETASMLLGQAVYDMVHYAFLKRHRFLPRDKDLLDALDALDPELGTWTRAFFSTGDREARRTLATKIADRTIETRGFFTWASEPEDVR
jgi:predicted nucleotidyltransferase